MIRGLLITSAVISAAIVAGYGSRDGVDRADFTYVNPSGINTLDPAAGLSTTLHADEKSR